MPGIEATMREFKNGKLRSGSKTGPRVKSRKQAIAIALSEARKGGKIKVQSSLKKLAGKRRKIHES